MPNGSWPLIGPGAAPGPPCASARAPGGGRRQERPGTVGAGVSCWFAHPSLLTGVGRQYQGARIYREGWWTSWPRNGRAEVDQRPHRMPLRLLPPQFVPMSPEQERQAVAALADLLLDYWTRHLAERG